MSGKLLKGGGGIVESAQSRDNYKLHVYSYYKDALLKKN